MNWLKKLLKRNEALPSASPLADVESNKFTPGAQQTLVLARQEAIEFNHNFIGTEHLLLALIRVDEGRAVELLRSFGVDLARVRVEVEKLIGLGPKAGVAGNISYTPRVKKALSLAEKEAQALNLPYVGTEVILLGLLREGDGVAARVLKNLGVEADRIRREIQRPLEPLDLTTGAEVGVSLENEPAVTTVQAEPSTGFEPGGDVIDTSKRYDVYCAEGSQAVIYSNVLFKGVRSLFRTGADDFIEIEHATGQKIFLARSAIMKFCEHVR